jgi:hypothetical protein
MRQSFAGLQRDVTNKTIAHDDIHFPEIDFVTLDVAVVVEVARPKKLIGFLDDLIALDVLDPDIEQRYQRPLLAFDGAHQQ